MAGEIKKKKMPNFHFFLLNAGKLRWLFIRGAFGKAPGEIYKEIIMGIP